MAEADREPPIPPLHAKGVLPEGFLRDLRADPEVAARRWTSPVGDGVVQLPRFAPEWCAGFVESYDARLAQLEGLGRRPGPPNSMHEGGAALADLGWGGLFDGDVAAWLRPLAGALFASVGGATIDTVYGFVAEYGPGADRDLGFHADNAEVTLNLCLGGDFSGSELYFRGRRCAHHRQSSWTAEEELEFQHEPGVAILHAGAHRHGVDWIDRGRRLNLILWLQSTRFRSDAEAQADSCPEWCDHDGTASTS